jgi:hypothetical protein
MKAKMQYFACIISGREGINVIYLRACIVFSNSEQRYGSYFIDMWTHVATYYKF